MKLSIVTGSFNEEDNVNEWFSRVLSALSLLLPKYRFTSYEIVWIDNASTDHTAQRVKEWCEKDSRIKLIVNARNFGPVRSPFHGLMQCTGDVACFMASDLQDPPELLDELLTQWRVGYEVVAGVYSKQEHQGLVSAGRIIFYKMMHAISEAEQIPAFTGFGVYSRKAMELLREYGGPAPYVRGLVTDLGLSVKTVAYEKPHRKYGVSKNDALLLIDQALTGITAMSRAPLRIATLLGFGMSVLSFGLAVIYLLAKLLFWNEFSLGQAPLLIGIFMFTSVQIFIMGLIGEYVASIHMNVQKRPLVIEKERVNFEMNQGSD